MSSPPAPFAAAWRGGSPNFAKTSTGSPAGMAAGGMPSSCLSSLHGRVEAELKSLLGIPEGAFIAATVTLGRPEGSHGPVRRLPLGELVFADAWGAAADWAVDPPGTRHTRGGPPKAEAD